MTLIGYLIAFIVGVLLAMITITYQVKILNAMNPTRKKKDSLKSDQTIIESLGLTNIKLTEYERYIASNLVDPFTLTTNLEQIGGLQSTIDEIRETLINPINYKRIFTIDKLVRPPKGILLYGPPGCGKTMIAKATAKATRARFLDLQLSSMMDKWCGKSQKRVEAVFSLAQKLQPTIIFIDEIDSFLRNRSFYNSESTSMLKTQFMNFWDGLATDEDSMVVVMGATNRLENVDAAILRRMPSKVYIGLPNMNQREQILNVIIGNKREDQSINVNELAHMTDGWSGCELKELCRCAAAYRASNLLNILKSNGMLNHAESGFLSLTSEDFTKAYKRSGGRKVPYAGFLFAECS